MSETYAWGEGVRGVDAAADPVGAAAWQDRMSGWPAIRAYKRRTYELLGGSHPVLDVGSGTGVDLPALGPFAVGVDPSAVMCEVARSRGARCLRAEAARLPFSDQSFGGVRADRVVQHLADPIAGLAEMVRVTRPGGRVVVADPDQGSLVIHVPGAPDRLVDAVTAFRRDHGYRNGSLARRLPSIFGELGLDDVTVGAFALVLTDPDDAFGLPGWVSLARTRGADPEAGDEALWAEGCRQARVEGGFVYAVSYLVVSGVRR